MVSDFLLLLSLFNHSVFLLAFYFLALTSRAALTTCESPARSTAKMMSPISHVLKVPLHIPCHLLLFTHLPFSPQPPLLYPPCSFFSFISSLSQFNLSCVPTFVPRLMGCSFVGRKPIPVCQICIISAMHVKLL